MARGEKIIVVGSNFKSNLVFLLIIVLLLSGVVYFGIKSWPTIQERMNDNDRDGVPNYRDQCPGTPSNARVGSDGCIIVLGTTYQTETKTIIKKELETLIKEKIIIEKEPEEKEEPPACTDTDGNNIWAKGTCTDADSSTTDKCPQGDFTKWVNEEWCENNICMGASFDCSLDAANCYDGRCISWDQDSDGDGHFDLDEYEEGTDPNDPNDFPGVGEGEGCESNNCECSDDGSGMPEKLLAMGVCDDDCGSHMDECVDDNTLRQWYCAPVADPVRCDYVEYGCVAWFGAGSYCTGGVCIMP